MTETKECGKCGPQPISKFFKCKSGHNNGRYTSYCYDCSKAGLREHYAKNTDYYKFKSRVRHNVKRKWMLDYLADKQCKDCGEKDPVVLTFDHLDPSRKTATVSSLINSSVERITKEIAKCEIVCSNCHARRTAKTQKWYDFREGFEYPSLEEFRQEQKPAID